MGLSQILIDPLNPRGAASPMTAAAPQGQRYNPNLDRWPLNPRGVASLMAVAAPQGQGYNPQITLILPTSNDDIISYIEVSDP
jgi:hypothetical protein